LEFNQSEKRKPISSLVIFALIGQNSIQSRSPIWYGFKNLFDSCRRNSGNMLRLFVTIVALAVLVDAKLYRWACKRHRFMV